MMEYFLVHKTNFHRLFSEDEFFYPLVFNTPLLQARYIGQPAKVFAAGRRTPLEGMFLGLTGETLNDFLRKRLPPQTLSSTLATSEDEEEWLRLNTRNTAVFGGVKCLSNPGRPPYRVFVCDAGHFILLASVAESEADDIQMGYNLVITNEAIEALTSLVKRRLPHHAEKFRGQKHPRHSPLGPATGKARQAHLKKFLGT
ncbi:MAG: hypothetical protein V1787_06565 [Candidatus Micrarchaeota archaeon]